ncbi:MAG: glycosyltransferase [Bacteroidetes bacterium]|nr:glycosyltransferase [Bacteroidota bacterium]
MKVLMLCNKSPWPTKEGGPIAMNAMVRGLLQAGYSLKILALNTNKYPVQSSSVPVEFRDKTNLSLVDTNLSFQPFTALKSLFTGQSYHVQRFITPQIEAAIVKILSNETFDIIQFESIFLTPYISVIRKYSKAKLVLRSHNIEHHIWQRLANYTTNPFRKIVLRHLASTLENYECSILNQLDGIMTITTKDETRFKTLGFKNLLSTIPLSIEVFNNTTVVSPVEPISKQTSLFHIGSMNWIPNQGGIRWFLHECWPLIHNSFPLLKLVLAGREMPMWLKKTIMSGVDIQGEVESSTDFILENGIMVVPLFAGSGVRVKILEAMALGRPVISTMQGAEGIECTDGLNILIANTPEEFLSAITKCLTDPNLVNTLIKNALQIIQTKHQPDQVSKLADQFYKQLIQFSN